MLGYITSLNEVGQDLFKQDIPAMNLIDMQLLHWAAERGLKDRFSQDNIYVMLPWI